MTDTIHQIPLTAITFRITRDRTYLDKPDYEELRFSILKHGLRQPIEVFTLPDPTDEEREAGQTYAVISGMRRYTAFEDLNANFVPGKFASIPALIRPFTTVPEALRLMVEENELHAPVAPWDKGYLIIECITDGIFATIDDAIAALYPGADATKRSRLRSFAIVYRDLEGVMKGPQTLSIRQMIRLAAAIREGWGETIRRHIGEIKTESPEEQWRAIEPLLIEFEQDLANPTPSANLKPGRPIRFAIPKKGVRIRRTLTPHGWTLHFAGHDATSGFMDDLLENILAWYEHHN